MIDLRNITKIYDMGTIQVEVLKGITLHVKEGDFISIMGPSGSGKSTLMNMIGCLDIPTTGEYYLDGKEISTYNEKQLSKIRNEKIGFIFQKFNLLPKLTAYENVELPLIYRGIDSRARKEKALEVLERVGLTDRITHNPTELSGGQQQRVAIARALAGDPPVLLADEPTGNLDSKSGSDVINLIKQLSKEGKTIVLITHDSEIAEAAHKTVVIRDGILLDKSLKGEKYECKKRA
jgi:putative ABC transport system ATP-binding protein